MSLFKRIYGLLFFIPFLTFGQASVFVEVKPSNPKEAYNLLITRMREEVKIVYQKADSLKKVEISSNDQQVIKDLLNKPAGYFDSLSKDSIAFFQHKIDSIRSANTVYQSDSTSIYKKTHPAYWKLLDVIFSTPKEALESKNGTSIANEKIDCFFTITSDRGMMNVIIDSLAPKDYPLLSELVTKSLGILAAHRKVMEKKNQ